MKNLQKESEKTIKLTENKLNKLVNDAAKEALSYYLAAEYDGRFDVDIVKTKGRNMQWSIEAVGEDVKFIEYGTGVQSEAPDSEHKDYWFFTVDDEVVFNTPKGGLAHQSDDVEEIKRYRITRIDKVATEAQARRYYDKRYNIETLGDSPWTGAHNTKTGKAIRISSFEKFLAQRTTPEESEFKNKGIPLNQRPIKQWSGISYGNKPNHCMLDVADYIKREVPLRVSKK